MSHPVPTPLAAGVRLPLALTVAICIAACTPVRYTESFQPHSALGEKIVQVKIRSDVGDVELVPGESLRVQRAIRAAEGTLELSHHIENGILYLDAACTTLLPCAVDLRLDIPVGIPVSVEINKGEVWATGLTALDVELGEGSVNVEIDGPLQIRVGRGQIEAEITEGAMIHLAVGDGDVKVKTVAGSVFALDLAADLVTVEGVEHDETAPGRLEVVAPSGTILVRGKEPLATR